MKRIVAASLLILLAMAEPAAAQGRRETLVVVMDGASLPDLLATPQFDALASLGGVALLNGRTGVRRSLLDSFEPKHDPVPGELALWPIVYRDIGTRSPSAAAVEVETMLESSFDDDDPTLLLVISATPSAATTADGDELGTVVAGWGQAGTLLQSPGRPHALTSDSTRRAGVVADVDPAATVAEWLDLPYDAGAPIERTGEPAPLDLYERYLQQRRLVVPAAAASWGVMMLFGLAAVVALALRGRLSSRTLRAVEALTAALPWLALGLLLVGHLPTLTVASVIPSLIAFVAAGVAFTRWIAARRGTFVALEATGGVILAILAVEAAIGWPAAVTPLAGGGQLDGGRFFGMPNIEIGIVLGAAMFLAHRLRVSSGLLLLVGCALVAGSPWTGANFGAAITLFAAAGMWLAIRRRRPWWLVVVITGAIAATGMAAIAIMHRFLTERPTHVTAFLEGTTSLPGVVDRFTDRLGIGFEQLTDTPLAAIPVVGAVVLLVLVLRPPAPIATSFEGHDAWRDAVLVLLLGAVVAYLANDTGAAAVGFGFGFALSGLLGVSLAAARGKMTR